MRRGAGPISRTRGKLALTNAPENAPVYAGIDLAADPARTGIAILHHDQSSGRLLVGDARLGADDDALVAAVTSASKTGVDVPFGWPRPFVEHLSAHASGQLSAPEDSGPDWRRSLAMRRTDLLTREGFGLIPLSVSTDRIAYPALRWSAVEARLRDSGLDCSRDGSGRICEVYPAAALKVWELPHRGYKKAAGTEIRENIVDALEKLYPQLDWNGHRGICVDSDDVLDAVISALVAREAADGRTWAPAGEDLELAASEGWIHVPVDS